MGGITDITCTVKKLNAALNWLANSDIINNENKRAVKDFIFSIRNKKKKFLIEVEAY